MGKQIDPFVSFRKLTLTVFKCGLSSKKVAPANFLNLTQTSGASAATPPPAHCLP